MMVAMNILAINIGNTRAAMGVFTEAQAKAGKPSFAAAYPLSKTFRPALPKKIKIGRVVIASVNPTAEKIILAYIKKTLGVAPLSFPKDFQRCIKNKYRNPKQTGADRLATALAAWNEFRAKCIVIDAGTAVTVDAVSARGEFLGGAILPGVNLQAMSLHRGTELLPEVKLSAKKPNAIGRSTDDCIAAGVALGVAGAVDRLVSDIQRELGRCKVVITGGDAEYLARICKTKLIVRPHLALAGIAQAALKC